MLKILKILFAVFGALLLLFASAQALSTSASIGKPVESLTQPPALPTPVSIEKAPSIDDLPLRDNPNIYQYDDPASVVTVYVTVRRGNSSDNSNYTWQEVNDFTKYDNNTGEHINNAVVGLDDAIVQFGDESGPLPGAVGYGAVVPNATISIRGASASAAPQKSYKIEFLSGAGTWRGQSTINLNKHPYDITRVENKLNFDLMKQIPNMTSLRTQFVHLYVKDETVVPPGTTFVDYGLFTQVEQPNQRFLRNHLLDPEGQLYKATAFEFFRYPDQILMADDPLYDIKNFSPILEIKGNNDHAKLIQMLNDVNNYDIPIKQTFEKYFNSDNFFTWMAYNILVGNIDTQSQNFYLYSPHNGNKWYFLPWDYDGTFPLQDRPDFGIKQYAPWANGVSNYWGAVLPNRVLRIEAYRKMLDDKINELRGFLTPERIKGMLDEYRKAVDPYLLRNPDLNYIQLASSLENRDQVFDLLPGDIQTNYNFYLESLKKPMPFFLNPPAVDAGQLFFSWGESYDFNGQDVTYTFEVSKDVDFKDIKKIEAQTKLTNVTDFQMQMLKPGTYFWRVISENQSGKTQIPFDIYYDASANDHYGVKTFTITADGQVIE